MRKSGRSREQVQSWPLSRDLAPALPNPMPGLVLWPQCPWRWNLTPASPFQESLPSVCLGRLCWERGTPPNRPPNRLLPPRCWPQVCSHGHNHPSPQTRWSSSGVTELIRLWTPSSSTGGRRRLMGRAGPGTAQVRCRVAQTPMVTGHHSPPQSQAAIMPPPMASCVGGEPSEDPPTQGSPHTGSLASESSRISGATRPPPEIPSDILGTELGRLAGLLHSAQGSGAGWASGLHPEPPLTCDPKNVPFRVLGPHGSQGSRGSRQDMVLDPVLAPCHPWEGRAWGHRAGALRHGTPSRPAHPFFSASPQSLHSRQGSCPFQPTAPSLCSRPGRGAAETA